MPVIAVPDCDHPVVLGSNWGQHPAWYYNLRAYATVTVTVGVSRRVLAYEAVGRVGDRPVHPAARWVMPWWSTAAGLG